MARTIRPLSQRLLVLQRQFATTSWRHDSASHAELLDSLKEIDSVALAKTKRLIATIGSHSSSLSSVVSATIPAAATIQLNPTIPPYKPSAWAQHASTLQAQFSVLQQRIARLDANLSDLECIPYRAENGEMDAQNLKEQIAHATESDKKTEYQNLKFQEDAIAHRAKTFMDSLEASIDAWREEQGMRPFASVPRPALGSRVEAEKSNSNDAVKEKKITSGWGQHRPAFQGVVVGSPIEAAKSTSDDVDKGKEVTSGWGRGGTSLAEEDEDVQPKPKPMPSMIRSHTSGKKSKAKEEPQSPTLSEATSTVAEEGKDAKPPPRTFRIRKRMGKEEARVERGKNIAVVIKDEIRASQAPEGKEEVNGKEHEEKKESKAPSPSKPRDLFALQAAIDRSLKG